VRCLLRPASRTDRIDGLPVERAAGDVRDPGSLQHAAAGCREIVHLASPSSWNELHASGLDEVVVRGTANVLAAARAAGVERMLFVSSATAVNGSEEPRVHDEESACTMPLRQLPYARAKREAEALCRAAADGGQDVVTVNPAEVYGPNDSVLVTARNLVDFAKGRPALVCRGGTSVAFVEDVAAGILAALERGRRGERYILGGENLTIRELCETTQRLLGRRPSCFEAPRGPLRAAARAAEALRLPFPVPPAVIPYATRYWFVSSAKAERELGVRFRGALDTLRPTLDWLEAAGQVARC
jgi:dihydroflavonol-4-reductase